MNMVVYFDPAGLCDLHLENLVLAPLPAKKDLWDASNEFIWKTESDREPQDHFTFGLATNGELVKLDENRLHCSAPTLPHKSSDSGTRSRCVASWEEWCSGMDGLGGLVMLAASLVG